MFNYIIFRTNIITFNYTAVPIYVNLSIFICMPKYAHLKYV